MSEWQILRSLAKEGKRPPDLRPEGLFEFDQDHYGGLEAVEALAARTGIDAGSVVLDLCSGLGGPARFLAWRYGCRVTGVDITRSRVEASRRLTEYVKLDDRVQFVEADVTELPLRDREFTACISQEAFVHVRDKGALFSECLRTLKRGGSLAFTDWVAAPRLSRDERNRLRADFAAEGLVTADGYCEALQRMGFADVTREDLSDEWARILGSRLEMYRSLRQETVVRFGPEHYDRYDRNYAFFVDLVEAGKVGGARFSALHS